MELLELEMRARAIKAFLMKEEAEGKNKEAAIEEVDEEDDDDEELET